MQCPVKIVRIILASKVPYLEVTKHPYDDCAVAYEKWACLFQFIVKMVILHNTDENIMTGSDWQSLLI